MAERPRCWGQVRTCPALPGEAVGAARTPPCRHWVELPWPLQAPPPPMHGQPSHPQGTEGSEGPVCLVRE